MKNTFIFLLALFSFAARLHAQFPGSGNAVRFDGTDDFISIPDNAAHKPSAVTVEAWVKVNSFTSTKEGANTAAQYIVFKANTRTGLSLDGYSLFMNESTKIFTATAINPGGSNRVVSSASGSVESGKWYHLALVLDNTDLSFYVNGILQGTSTFSTGFPSYNTKPLFIGRSGEPTFEGFFNGDIDEVRIWNMRLTEAQIRDRMCHKLEPESTVVARISAEDPLYGNLGAYYRFDETGGDTVTDFSFNTNHGTLSGGSRVTSGAPIGDVSSHDYNNQNSIVSINNPFGGSFTVDADGSGTTGLQVYRVDEQPNSFNGLSPIGALFPTPYFGVFHIGAGTYTAVFDIAGNPILFPDSRPVLRVHRRADNAVTEWEMLNLALQPGDSHWTFSGESTEYILGGSLVLPPTVTVNQAAGQADPTGDSPINFTVVFSEPVTGFTDADVLLSGTAGATTAVVTGSGATYNVAVSGMTQSGTVVVIIPAGVAINDASAANEASTSTDNTVQYNAPPLCQPIRFVKQGASGSGASWADASGDLQAMIDRQAECGGGEVWVAAGTYIPVRRADATGTLTPNDRDNAFVLRNNVKVFGGFAGTEAVISERVLNPALSILSGDFNGDDQVTGSGSTLTFEHNTENAYHVLISAGNNSTAIIDGFTVSGGFADGSSGITVNGNSIFRSVGGGMYNQSSSSVISNSIFSKNSTPLTDLNSGGGMYNSSSSPVISNSTFSLNSSRLGGGIMNNLSSFPDISHCSFTGNLVIFDGGGMNNQNDAAPTVSHCLFTGNVALTGNGGGMMNFSNAFPIVNNCTFTGNTGVQGGGMRNSTNSSVTVSNCEFSNNTASNNGGGISNGGGTTSQINECTFTGNTAVNGGGLSNISASPTVSNSGFTGNTASNLGGGMYNQSSTSVLTANTFISNTARSGGGMCNNDSSPNITASTFSGNTAVSDGGGMYGFGPSSGTARMAAETTLQSSRETLNSPSGSGNTGSLAGTAEDRDLTEEEQSDSRLRLAVSSFGPVIDNCTFTGNTAGSVGGGLLTINWSPRVTNSTFANNTAVSGAGMYNGNNSAPSIDHCRFTGNTASGRRGGGMMNASGAFPTVSNSLFAGNSAAQTGGGMVNVDSSDPHIINSTFTANTAGLAGGGIRNNESNPVITNVIIFDNSSGIEDSLSTPAVTFSLVQGGYPGEGNINADPLFVNAAAGDYHLQDCSPAINSGSNAAASGLSSDLDGAARIQQGNVDMGAFENEGLSPVTLSINFASPPITCDAFDGMIAFNTNLPDGEYTLNFKFDTKDTTALVDVTTGFIFLDKLGSGSFSAFSMTGADGCTGRADTVITFSDGPTVSFTFLTFTNPTACGLRNGTIVFFTDQPDDFYGLRFQKDGKDTVVSVPVTGGLINIEGLGAGIYSNFSFTVSGFCISTFKGPVTLTGPPAPALTAGEITHVSGCQGTDGSIAFSTGLPNGSYPMAFKKDGKDTTVTVAVARDVFLSPIFGLFTLDNLSAGVYSAFSITADGCTSVLDTTLTLNAPSAPVLATGAVTNPTTCGAADGSITFSTTLPDGSFTLSFKKAAKDTTATVTVSGGGLVLSGLTAGIYSAFSITTDGCISASDTTLTLNAPSAPVLTAGTVTDPSVCGSTDGSIAFDTSLPDGSYTLHFTKNGTGTSAVIVVDEGVFTLSGLGEGTFAGFSITDNGCTGMAVEEITLKSAESILALDTKADPTTCGAADGSITFSTNLPDGSYVLSFKKAGNDTTATVAVNTGVLVLSGLTAGEYTMFSITINGNNGNSRLSESSGGCVYSFSEKVTLAAPPGTLVFKEKTDPTTCGVSDATISFTTGLPSGSYTLNYTLDGNPDTTAVTVSAGGFTLSNLSGGTYAGFSITTETCEYVYQGEIVITNPVAPGGVITPDGPTELCEDDLVSLTAAEGASYLWSTGDTTRTIIVGAAATYSVTVTSAQGCKSEADIIVTEKICNLPPVAVCKPLVVLVANADCYAVLSAKDLDAGSYDPNGDWTRHSLLNTDGIFRPGNYTVTYEVMDPKGAFSTCESRVQVVDHTPPVARARDLILELNANGQVTISVADVDNGSYDNCGPVTLSLNRTTFDCSDLGNLQVKLTVTDASGNVSEVLSDIRIVDNTPPVINATDLTLTLDENGRASITNENLITGISDNCGIWSVNVSQNEFTCEHLGENRVVITVEDVQGNRTTDTVTVTVQDNTPPLIRVKDITLYLDKDGKATLTTAMVDDGSSDNCGITNLSIDQQEFDCDDLGEQTLTLTAIDAAGNSSEATFTVTVLDTLAPMVLAKDITLYLDAAGKAALSPQDIDEGSSDNCGISQRSLQYTAFDCGNVGTQPVQYTVTDASGNSTTVTIQVTIRDIIAPEALARNVVVELDWDGKATLYANDVDDGSSDNCGIAELSVSQTDFSCADLGRRLVTLTVRDVNGNQSSDRAVVEVKDPNGVCPCSYGVLAYKGITLRSNEVSAGGVGVINKGKKIRLRNTVINDEGTFVKAPQSRFDNKSAARIYIRGAAPTPGAFRNNSYKDKNNEKAGNGESRTLAAGRYGRIKAGKDATLTFSGGEVYIRSLKAKKNASLVFSDNTVLLVREGVKLGRNAAVNTRGEQISIYAGGRITLGNASEARGMLHARGNLKARGGGEITSLEGLFVANKIRGGRNTHWAGGGVLCTGNDEPEPILASEKGKKSRPAESVEAPADLADADIRVSVWPNPAVEKIQVQIESETPDGDLLLVDMRGNIVYRKAYTGKHSLQEMNLGKLPTGTYILRVSSGGKEKTLRVFKEKR